MTEPTLIEKVQKAIGHTYDHDARHAIGVVSDWLRTEGYWQAADYLISETVYNHGEPSPNS